MLDEPQATNELYSAPYTTQLQTSSYKLNGTKRNQTEGKMNLVYWLLCLIVRVFKPILLIEFHLELRELAGHSKNIASKPITPDN